MIKIRLSLAGSKKRPFYRIVAIDKKRKGKASNFIEVLGYWSPKNKEVKIKKERFNYWIEKGAKTNASLEKILKNI